MLYALNIVDVFFCGFTKKFFFLSLQAKIEQMTDIIKRLKVCVKWFQQVDETHVQEKENLRVSLESAEQKYNLKGYFLSSDSFT